MSAETTPTTSSTQPPLTDEEWEARLKQEEAAFIAMHPQLLEKYEGKHVAIYGGQLIDVDDDFAELYDRVLDKYGDDTPIYFNGDCQGSYSDCGRSRHGRRLMRRC